MDGKKRVRRRWSWPDYGLGAGTVAVIGVVVALLAVFVYHRSVDPASATERPENPYPKAEHRIAVLGDSFASGEGARAFWTDSKNCHRTWASYAYTIAVDYHEGLTFPACSGAVIDDIDPTPGPATDAAEGPTTVPASAPKSQLQVLREAENVDLVLVQISGNDVGFGDIVAACVKANYHVGQPCSSQQSMWLKHVDDAYSRLKQLYEHVKTVAGDKGAAVVVMGYPNPFGPSYCTASQLRPEDWIFVHETFIPHLDQMIKQAAKDAGVTYVPLDDVFAGFGICEMPVGATALNTISYLSGLPGHDSFHPNAIGHMLMANRIERVLRTIGRDVPKAEEPAQPATPTASTLPVASTLGPDVDTSPCHADTLAGIAAPASAASLDHLVITGAAPASQVCYRAGTGTWSTTNADAGGQVDINVGGSTPSSIEVIYQDAPARWNRALYVPAAT